MIDNLPKVSVLGIKGRFSWDSQQQLNLISFWANKNYSRFVCCSNVHMFVIAKKSLEFRENVFTSADLITLDGKPIHWLVELKSRFYWLIGYSPKYNSRIEQVCGRDLMHKVLNHAAEESISVGFYGNSSENLNKLISNVKSIYPKLNIDFAYSPPFRPLSQTEKAEITALINNSKSKIIFVSLGCPKQEYWMAENRANIKAVTIGVGGAFDILAGVKQRPPFWVQNLGFEWLFRLIQEPKRLFYRNICYSPQFLFILFLRFCSKFYRHLISKLRFLRFLSS